MILYLDTSSLVKLYVTETGSEDVRSSVAGADVVATSVVAFPEARSAFARLAHEGVLSEEDHAAVKAAFLRDWDSFFKIRVLKRVYERAGDLTERHGLRGFDALHLASYLGVQEGADEEDVVFSAFDHRLTTAAVAEEGARGPV